MRTTWKTISNKTKLTFLLSLTFLFLSPSVSFSQTFKCEFIQEKFRGGKSNKASCSGYPEFSYGYGTPRNHHCNVDKLTIGYEDYIDFNVNLNSKKITYSVMRGHTAHGVERMVAHHKRKGDLTEKEVREQYRREGRKSFDYVMNIISSSAFTEVTNRNRDNNYKGEQHPSYLITYEHDLTEYKQMSTLYIPFHGESIISEHGNDLTPDGKTSWVNLTFGKCAQTSD